jgi:tRNA A-37 threonylcarbamoyl transferase component Bud32
LRRQLIPLPVPVFAISRRRGIFWRSAFASIDLKDARDGLRWLEEGPSPAQISAMCIVFARSSRRLHDAGAIHGDLQIRNLLIEDQHCLFIDLDRTRFVDRVSARQRVRELLRFARSLEKTGHASVASKRSRALVLSAYCGEDRGLRRSMMRWSRIEALRMSRHRIAWRFGRLAS